MKTAILFIIFNRLDTTQKVFEKIHEVQPERLYLASDGPRKNKEGEDELVQNVRQWVLDHIDWPCTVKERFNSENLGCGKNVSGAITWFFENEAEGIILEDDCVPHSDFFGYCEELLSKYRDDKRVWHICGTNPLGISDILESYFFSKYMHCWGWASWADRWRHYTFDLKEYDKSSLKNLSSQKEVWNYFKRVLEKMKRHEVDTWDYQWFLNVLAYNGLCIMPAKNLISNIGLVGTHMTDDKNPDCNRPVYPCLPLVHPQLIALNPPLNQQVIKRCISISDSPIHSNKITKKIIRLGCALIPITSWRRRIRTAGFARIEKRQRSCRENKC